MKSRNAEKPTAGKHLMFACLHFMAFGITYGVAHGVPEDNPNLVRLSQISTTFSMFFAAKCFVQLGRAFVVSVEESDAATATQASLNFTQRGSRTTSADSRQTTAQNLVPLGAARPT